MPAPWGGGAGGQPSGIDGGGELAQRAQAGGQAALVTGGFVLVQHAFGGEAVDQRDHGGVGGIGPLLYPWPRSPLTPA